MRAYAATMPFLVFIPCLGIDFVTRKISMLPVSVEKMNNAGFYPFIAAVLILTFLIPLFIHGERFSLPQKDLDCKENQNYLIFSVNKNSSLRVRPENEFFLDWAPTFHFSRFYKNIRGYSFSDFVDPLSELDPPFELRVGINLINDEDVYVVFTGESSPKETGVYEICAVKKQYSNSPWLRELAKLYFVQEYRRIEE